MRERIALEKIFKDYKNKIYGLALSITRNQADAEDVMQTVFIKIINNINKLKNHDYLSTWIYKIAYNESLMYLRKRSSQFKLKGSLKDNVNKEFPGLFVNWTKMPDERLLDDEFKERIDNSIRRLPIKYRMPLVLHYIERLRGREAATILRLKPESFKTRLRRAQMMIEEEVSSYLKDKMEKPGEEKSPKCGMWQGFLYSYARDYLSKGRKDAFDQHIKDCRGCKSFLKQYTKAMRVTEWLECRDLPPELEGKIMDFLSSERMITKNNDADG